MKTNDINKLFNLSHRVVNQDLLIPISRFQNNQFRLKIIEETEYEIPLYEIILNAIKHLDKPIDRFYFNDNFHNALRIPLWPCHGRYRCIRYQSFNPLSN